MDSPKTTKKVVAQRNNFEETLNDPDFIPRRMKKLLPLLLGATAVLAGNALAQNATTTPVGAMTVTIPAGTGTTAKTSLISLPLLQAAQTTGKNTGRISGVTATTISDSTAGWTAGELSAVASPKLIQITSGSAAGRMFLISTTANNTQTTLTISSTDAATVNLTTLGINVGTTTGDTYRLFDCDTMASTFGTPATTGVLGGTTVQTADNIVLSVNGSPSTYFYKTDATPPRWTRSAFGTPDATNTPIPPYYGVQYKRLGATPIQVPLTGEVPSVSRAVVVKNSGTTFLAHYWPVDTKLSETGIQSLPGWTSGATTAVADTVVTSTNGAASTYWYDGTNWRKSAFGNPISNTATIPAGTTLYLVKKGVTAGYSTLTQSVPYSLQ